MSAWLAPARQPGRKQVARGGTRAQPPSWPACPSPHPSATLLPERKVWQWPPRWLGGKQSCGLILLGHLGHGADPALGVTRCRSLSSLRPWHRWQSLVPGDVGQYRLPLPCLLFSLAQETPTESWDFVFKSLRHFYYLNGHFGLLLRRWFFCHFSHSGCCFQ